MTMKVQVRDGVTYADGRAFPDQIEFLVHVVNRARFRLEGQDAKLYRPKKRAYPFGLEERLYSGLKKST